MVQSNLYSGDTFNRSLYESNMILIYNTGTTMVVPANGNSTVRFPHYFDTNVYNISYLDVVDEDLSESGRQHVTGGLAGTVTDVGHQVHSLELPANSVVDTLGFPPVGLELVIAIALVTNETLSALLDNLGARGRCDCHFLKRI